MSVNVAMPVSADKRVRWPVKTASSVISLGFSGLSR